MFYLWVFLRGLHIDLLVVLFSISLGRSVLYTCFWKEKVVAIFLAEWAHLVGFFCKRPDFGF